MFWQEDEDKTPPWQAPEEILDLSFAIRCKHLPQDHNWALATAIKEHLPWIGEDHYSGIHSIHVAADANGWLRPEDGSEQLLIPSRRTRLLLRITKEKLEDAQQLSGKTLDVAGHRLTVGAAKEKPLQHAAVLFARYVLADENQTEDDFLQRMANEIQTHFDFKVRKMMCGRSHYLQTPDGPQSQQFTRHLMIADLNHDVSLRLQQLGLAGGKAFGCGLFLPHKEIKALKKV